MDDEAATAAQSIAPSSSSEKKRSRDSGEPSAQRSLRARPDSDGSRDENDDDDDDNDDDEARAAPRKRKRAVLFGYSGTGYYGLQAHAVDPDRAPEHDTIENALHRALFRAGAFTRANATSLAKLGWSRCGRTDKGVHAASQVIAAKLTIPGKETESGEVSDADMAAFVRDLNRELPASIRVYKLVRVPGSFDAQKMCSGRVYCYAFPKRVLGDRPDALQKFNRGIAAYEGTHRFHNFTEKLRASDPSSQRIILSCTSEEDESDARVVGEAVIRVTVRGQSFLLHQIRRMMGFVIEVVRKDKPDPAELVRRALDPGTVLLGSCTAPAEGLFLNVAVFDAYNEGVVARRSAGLPAILPIDFEGDAEVRAQRERLVRDAIMPAMFPASFPAFDEYLQARDRFGESDFPVFSSCGDSLVERLLGQAEAFVRHVSLERHKRWHFDERDRM